MKQSHTVKLREKKLNDGRLSLYLDFYPPVYIPETGKETRREFLKIYLFEKPTNAIQKEHNHVCKTKAESIRAERSLQFINKSFDFTDRLSSKMDFLAYFEQKVKKRNSSKGNSDNWLGSFKYLKLFTGGRCTFGEVDERFCEGFKEFLKNVKSLKSDTVGLAQNSQYSYFNKFRACVKEAFEERLFSINPILRVKGIPQGESEREYLTIEELKALFDTDCEPNILKRASIFCALTGLRWSDMIKLTWREVQHSEQDGYFIRFTQQKTSSNETLPIADQAYDQLGERGNLEDRVFKGLKYSAYTNVQLARWVMSAGITKKITFHCFRHTYATLQLTMGTDIYTVSKLLGHRHLKTTEVYAKVIDKKKVDASKRIVL
ncbi:site-specific integrase [Pedobacter punctiformis]|uniref:Site-specific integrase n=1 Tax=Pedobacter punctiformis TaxID=3004097 RepID=A0ABT4LFB8_9SPHI|nr:site-specific integrase [Pedobacter sp. HCMS5-2]MCZ4245838.1 site-specific integrase [Pedobacter sp. HCMS5-2]